MGYDREITCGNRGAQLYIDRRVAGRLVFAYSPKAVDGQMCLDIVEGNSKYAATKMEGTRQVSTLGLNETTYNIHGVKNILALFTQTGPNGTELQLQQDPTPFDIVVIFFLYI
jgi:hypothetical protein